MDIVNAIWLAAFVSFLIYVVYWYFGVPKNLPPGTAGIPFLGYLPFVQRQAQVTFENLKNKYGNIFHLYLGNRLVIVLNDYEAIKEAFIKQAEIFAGRPADASFHTKPSQNFGISFSDGEHWKQHRRFLISNLKDHGVGKLILEPIILNEIHHFLEEIKKRGGKCFPIKTLLSRSLVNNILIMVRGKRFEYTDPSLEQFSTFVKATEKSPLLDFFMFFPFLLRIPGFEFFTNKYSVKKANETLYELIKKMCNELQEERQGGDQGIFINDYLNKKESEERLHSRSVFTDTGLLHSTRDLLFAGSDTITTTLLWAILYLTKYPEVQTKVQEEIDRVIGREREPSFNDRTKMPYAEATILEINRINSVVPLALPHRNIKSTTTLGFSIPKDTMIIPNISAVHNDKTIWGDPQNFQPERFLSTELKIIKSEYVINFSIGKRACAGEPLAKMEIFLYFISLFQHFNFVPPDGVIPSLEETTGVIRRPKCDNVCAVPR